jgi:hypothetical protein
LATIEGTDRLTTLTGMGRNSDVRVGSNWIFFAIGSYLLWASIAFFYVIGWLQQVPSYNIPLSVFGTLHFSAITWLLLLSFAISTGLSYLVYAMINRQNGHVAREEELFEEALKRVRARTSKDQMSVLLPLSSAEQDFYRLVQKSRDRSALLWGLLVLIPYAGWIFLIIALYLVSQDLNSHEQTEQLLLQDIGRVLAGGTDQQAPPSGATSGRANSLAYLLVSFATLGVVSLFWLHRITVEQEAHFEQHDRFEPGLLQALPDSGSKQGSAL